MAPTIRRLTALLVSALLALTGGALAGPAVAAPAPGTAADRAMVGLYGQQDATYDGVYRQSLAILALHASDARIQRSAVRWLLRQQCANGRWTSFRSDLAAPCGDPDSNATALAVMALKAVGRNGAARQGRDWLIGKQLPGGGWEYSTGWGPDANSTGLAVQALVAMGVKPATVSNKGTPFDFLKTLQLDCTTSPDDRGALDYQEQTPQVANDFATAQVGQALARTALPVDWRRARSGLPRLDCPGAKGALLTTRPGQAAAGYLGRVLKDHRGVIPNAFGPGPDFGTTANAVLSLVAARRGARQVDRAMTRLESGARSFVIDDGQTVPAAAAVLTLAFETTRGNPRDVDDMNLVKRIHRSITTRP